MFSAAATRVKKKASSEEGGEMKMRTATTDKAAERKDSRDNSVKGRQRPLLTRLELFIQQSNSKKM